MEFSEVLQNRRSVRCFNDQQIERETLVGIIKDAQHTPSWANSQPWRVYLATGKTLDSIKAEHYAASSQGVRGQAEFSTMHREAWTPKTRRNMGNWSSQIRGHLGTEHADEYGNSQRDLFHAAAIVYLTIPAQSSLWSVFDLGAFSQTLMYSAVARGVATMSAYETVKYPQIVRKWMDIPETEMVAMGIALGHADDYRINAFVSDREPLDQILTVKD